MKCLKRLARLYHLNARMDLLWIFRSPMLAITCILSDLIVSVSSVLGVALLAVRFDGIGPWTRPQLLFMLAYGTLVAALLDLFCGFNILFLSRRIGRGQLDHMLLQPQPLLFSLLSEGFLPFSGTAALLVAIELFAWATRGLDLPANPFWWLALLLNLLGSSLVVLSYNLLWSCLAFWQPRSAEEVSSATGELMYSIRFFPLDAVSAPLLGCLMSLVPVGLTGWYPSRALLGMSAPWTLVVTPLAGAGMVLLATAALRIGLKQYARTGSQRYNDRGHRR